MPQTSGKGISRENVNPKSHENVRNPSQHQLVATIGVLFGKYMAQVDDQPTGKPGLPIVLTKSTQKDTYGSHKLGCPQIPRYKLNLWVQFGNYH